MRALLLASLLLASLPLLAPPAAATTCAQTHLQAGPIVVFVGEVGTGCLDGWIYSCTAHYYGGGHSLPVFDCEPWVQVP